MIALDTHTWIWWVEEPERLSEAQRAAITEQESDDDGVIGISATSLWEVAMLVARRRLRMDIDLADWFENALAYPRVSILGLTPEIAIESTRLPRDFPQDPSDQIIAATAIIHKCPLVTSDREIRSHTGTVEII